MVAKQLISFALQAIYIGFTRSSLRVYERSTDRPLESQAVLHLFRLHSKECIRQFIKSIDRERGVAVILTTHDLGDVEKLCQRVMMIDHSNLLFDSSPGELVWRFGGERELVVDFAEDYATVEVEGAADRGYGAEDLRTRLAERRIGRSCDISFNFPCILFRLDCPDILELRLDCCFSQALAQRCKLTLKTRSVNG